MHQCKAAVVLLSLISSSAAIAAIVNPESILAQEHNHGDFEGHTSAHTIHHVLKKANIIPSIIEDFNPLCYLNLTYPVSHASVSLGNKIIPEDAQNAPVVEVSCPLGFGSQIQHSVSGAELMLEDDILASSSNKKAKPIQKLGPFTVILTDPDAPSRKHPKWSEMCHWIATLSTLVKPSPVSSSSLSFELPPFMEIEHPTEIVPYKAPGPPPKTGYHRYVFLLFSGSNSNLTAPADRQHWGMGKKGKGVKEWAKKQGLQVVGANFFYARNKEQ